MQGYSNFFPNSAKVEIRDASQITTEDLRGVYFLSGDGVALEQVVADFQKAHLIAKPENYFLPEIWLVAIGKTHLFGVIATALITLILVVSFAVSEQKKIYAIRKIHGYTGKANLLFTLRQITKDFLVAFGIVFISGSIFLYIQNRFAQFGRFWIYSSVTFAFLIVFLFVMTSSAVILFSANNIPKAIKGEKGVLKLGVLALVVQILLIGVVAITINSSFARVSAIREALEVAQAWRTGDPLYRLSLSVNGTREDDEKAAPLLAEVIWQLEAENKVLLAYQDVHNGQKNPYAYGAA